MVNFTSETEMKQKNEVENLLSLIFQSGGKVEVKDDQLLVGPVSLAKRFGDQIKRLKPEIMKALGHTHCPVCGSKLIVETEHRERLSDGKRETGEATYCPMRGHFDKWEIEKGEGK